MIVLLLACLVAVALGGAGLLGVGALSSGKQRTGLAAAVSAPVVLVVGLAVGAVLLVGVQGGDDARTTDRPTPPPVGPAPTALPSARVEPVTSDLRVVLVRAAATDAAFVLYLPVSGLVPREAVRVLAQGFGEFASGRAEQCVLELGRVMACSQSFPVQFDQQGGADFLFVVRGDVASGGCRIGQATCLLRVRDAHHDGATQTVLADQWTAGQVRAMVVGGRADVSVTGLPPGLVATAVVCAPPALYDARRCTPGDTAFTLDPAGAGRTSVAIPSGRFGADQVRCGPAHGCAVVVVVGPGFLGAPPAVLSFPRGPGVEYDGGRLARGIGLAAVLVAAVIALALVTDWTKPTEAATPEMDRADLRAGASLDDLFGTDTELDQRDPVPW